MEAVTNRVQRPMTPEPPVIEEEYSRYFVEPPQPQSIQHKEYHHSPTPTMIDRNLVILIFIVFVIGLLLGKAMNPVVLTR